MSMIVNTMTEAKPQAEPGLNHLVLVKIIDIGTQKREYKGVTKPPIRKLRFTFVVPAQKYVFDEAKGPEPFHVHRTYTVSDHENAALPGVVKALAGVPLTPDFDIASLLGKNCMGELVKSDDGKYTNVGTLMGMQLGAEILSGFETYVFSLDQFDWNEFNELPTFVKEMIRISPQFKAIEAKTDAPKIEETTPFD
jgi:hypothetical protein